MTWSAELQNIAEAIMNTHKVTGAIAGATAALGTAGLLDLIHGTLSLCAIGAAVIATLALARYHRANEQNLKLKNKLLRQDLLDRGIDPKGD
ncbi:MAG: hypothetical protein JO253_08010 [Alphaproteobacteria bacterium]|nr:hypothetical protein [Alphaproteobacteria bacterium]